MCFRLGSDPSALSPVCHDGRSPAQSRPCCEISPFSVPCPQTEMLQIHQSCFSFLTLMGCHVEGSLCHWDGPVVGSFKGDNSNLLYNGPSTWHKKPFSGTGQLSGMQCKTRKHQGPIVLSIVQLCNKALTLIEPPVIYLIWGVFVGESLEKGGSAERFGGGERLHSVQD